jgi:DNA-binding response OmpR family regulator
MNRKFPRVLVIEDDPTTNHFLCKIFETWKWDTFAAFTCAEGISLLQERPYDLILLDMGLPDCRGDEVVKRVRASIPPIPVAVCTGMPMEQLTEIVALHPDHLFLKPIVWDALCDLAQKTSDNFFAARHLPRPDGGRRD